MSDMPEKKGNSKTVAWKPVQTLLLFTPVKEAMLSTMSICLLVCGFENEWVIWLRNECWLYAFPLETNEMF